MARFFLNLVDSDWERDDTELPMEAAGVSPKFKEWAGGGGELPLGRREPTNAVDDAGDKVKSAVQHYLWCQSQHGLQRGGPFHRGCRLLCQDGSMMPQLHWERP